MQCLQSSSLLTEPALIVLTVSQAEEDEEVPPLVAAAKDVKPEEQTERVETE